MSSQSGKGWSRYEGLITALAVGGFFIILGLVAVSTPNVAEQTNAFFRDLTGVTYPLGDGNLVLPAPANPAGHVGFFTAVMTFFIGIGVLQIAILALRIGFRSPISRIAETVGNLVFWIGGAITANVFLLAGTRDGWFQFWAWLIILAGTGLIARFIVLFASRSMRRHPTEPTALLT